MPGLLLVEDDTVDAMIFRRAAEKIGLDAALTIARDGAEALHLLRSDRQDPGATGHPALIVLDLNMPGMSGFEFLAELRQDDSLQDLVVFVLTTSRSPDDLERAYGFKVAGYLTKSPEFASFLPKLGLLDGYLRQVELPPSANL